MRRSSREGGGRAWLALAFLPGFGMLAYGLAQRAGEQASRAQRAEGAGANGPPRPNPPPDGGPQPPAGAVRPGTGVFTNDAPTEKKSANEALCAGCDIVLITVCSLRRDHLGAYGAPTGQTPVLDALAAEGIRFDNAWAASNFTLAGLTAVLTGRFGTSTGVIGWDKGLVGDIPTLPEVLGYYGYTTGGFTIDAPSGFRPDYGLDRGFQHLEIIDPPRDTPDGRHRNGEIGPGGASAGPAARWIQKQAPDAPLFVMLHTRSAHFPFVLEDDPSDKTGVTSALWSTGHQQTRAQTLPGHAGGTAQQGVVTLARDPAQEAVRAAGEAGLAMWKQRYAEAVHRTDRDIAVMVEALKAAGRWDRTVLLVVADHGESLGDHGELLHGDAYFDGVVHIPLLLRIPGLKPQHTSALASHVDIAPTLLDLVGAVPPADADGASIVPVLRGERADIRTTALVEGGVARQKAGPPRGAVISGPWALLRQDMGCPDGGGGPPPPGSPGLCLYNLHEDPGQTKNVAAVHPEVVTDLLGRWDAFRAAKATEARQLDLDPTFVESLQKSGYDFREEKTP